MVVYNLICDSQHRFEGWFGSGEHFEQQHAHGTIGCPVCGSASVQKLPAAMYVHTRGESASADAPAPATPADGAQSGQSVAALRKRVMQFIYQQTEDVGDRFTEHARKMHYHEIEAKNIRGTATPQQAAELSDEGIEIMAISAEFRQPDKLH